MELFKKLDKELNDARRAVELKNLYKELSSLDLLYSGFNKWFTGNQNHSLEQCRVIFSYQPVNKILLLFILNRISKDSSSQVQCFYRVLVFYSGSCFRNMVFSYLTSQNHKGFLKHPNHEEELKFELLCFSENVFTLELLSVILVYLT